MRVQRFSQQEYRKDVFFGFKAGTNGQSENEKCFKVFFKGTIEKSLKFLFFAVICQIRT